MLLPQDTLKHKMVAARLPSGQGGATRVLAWVAGTGCIYLLLAAWSLISLLSAGWLVISSLKTNRELFANVWGLFLTPQWSNYYAAWQTAQMSRFFLNSTLVCLAVVFLSAVISSMAAYILARFRFPGSRLLLIFFISGMGIPLLLITVPLYLLFNRLHMLDSLVTLTLVYVTVTLPFSIFLLVGFFRSIPHELEEAAVLDGASEYQIFWLVMLPLARPGLITVAIFNFLYAWNEYLLALTLISTPSRMTVPVGLYNLKVTQGHGGNWVALIAGLVLVMIPTFIVFVLLQRRITSGLTIGAVKG
jgi:ABC-type glycerol-3-phosphate transport system permease component